MSYALFFIPIFKERSEIEMDYLIANPSKTVFIRLDDNGRPVTCSKNDLQRFEYSKANNLVNNLPKTMKRFHFKTFPIPEISEKKVECDQTTKPNVISNTDYIPSENITRWIEKFSVCDDIISEARIRKEELKISLSNTDKELSNRLHIIELEKRKNACQGFNEYRQIRDILQKRREIKDELLIISNVLRNDFAGFSKENVRKSVTGLSNRKFTLRIVEEEESDVV